MHYTLNCPRCEQPNQCAFSKEPEVRDCWCNKLTIPRPVLDRIENEWGNSSCLCKCCLLELIEPTLEK